MLVSTVGPVMASRVGYAQGTSTSQLRPASARETAPLVEVSYGSALHGFFRDPRYQPQEPGTFRPPVVESAVPQLSLTRHDFGLSSTILGRAFDAESLRVVANLDLVSGAVADSALPSGTEISGMQIGFRWSFGLAYLDGAYLKTKSELLGLEEGGNHFQVGLGFRSFESFSSWAAGMQARVSASQRLSQASGLLARKSALLWGADIDLTADVLPGSWDLRFELGASLYRLGQLIEFNRDLGGFTLLSLSPGVVWALTPTVSVGMGWDQQIIAPSVQQREFRAGTERGLWGSGLSLKLRAAAF